VSVAVRTDALTGVEERLEHISTPRGLLYSWTARPPDTSACVLICSSVFGDFVANYHRERTLGRELAAKGLGVVRFHYAGEGNSQGERCDMTFATLCDDAAAVVGHARGLGFNRFAVLGTRLGSLVAAASLPEAPLALWEPVTHPLRFIAEAQRAKRISQVAQDREDNAMDWREELAAKGMLDLLGYEAYAPMIESLADVDLLKIIGSSPRSVFVGRFRGGAGVGDPLAQALRERGFRVETAVFGLSESWWFHNEFVSESGAVISATRDWLVAAIEEMA
jgi:hypothetical protein